MVRMTAKAALAIGLLVAAGSTCALAASGPSDLTVSRLMGYAWALTPNKFTSPDAKVIIVDKTKPNEVIVAKDIAVEVIRAGYRTYEADLCGLTDEAGANFGTMMARLRAKHKLTEQQTLYVNQLHMATLQYSKGGLKIVGEGDSKTVELLNIPERTAKECTDERRARVRSAVEAYLKAEPPTPPVPAAPARAEPAAPAAPAAKKK